MFESKAINGFVHRIEYGGVEVRDVSESGTIEKDAKVLLTLRVPVKNGHNEKFIEEITDKYFPGLDEMMQMSEENIRDYSISIKLMVPSQFLIVLKGEEELFKLQDVKLEGRPKIEIKEGEGNLLVKVSFMWPSGLDILKQADQSEVVFELCRSQGDLEALMKAAEPFRDDNKDSARNVIKCMGRSIEVGAIQILRDNVDDHEGKTEPWLIQTLEEHLAIKLGHFPGPLPEGHIIRIEEAREYFNRIEQDQEEEEDPINTPEEDDAFLENEERIAVEFAKSGKVYQFLTDNNIEFREGSELFEGVLCWECGEKSLDIEPDSGSFMCNVCDNEGEFEELTEALSKNPPSREDQEPIDTQANACSVEADLEVGDDGYPVLLTDASEKPVHLAQVDFRLCSVPSAKARELISNDDKLVEYIVGQRAALFAFIGGEPGKKVQITLDHIKAAVLEKDLGFIGKEDLEEGNFYGDIPRVSLPVKTATFRPVGVNEVDYRYCTITSLQALIEMLPDGLEESILVCQQAAKLAFKDQYEPSDDPGMKGKKLILKKEYFKKAIDNFSVN